MLKRRDHKKIWKSNNLKRDISGITQVIVRDECSSILFFYSDRKCSTSNSTDPITEIIYWFSLDMLQVIIMWHKYLIIEYTTNAILTHCLCHL